MKTAEAKAFGGRLRRFCKSNDSFSVLDSSKACGGTWTAGGCLILAEAVRRLLADGGERCWIEIIHNASPQHAVCAVETPKGMVYLDGDGFSTKESLLERWEKEEDLAMPISLDFCKEWPDCMPHPGNEQMDLFKALVKKVLLKLPRNKA